jgi:predicted dehydrogenase
MNPFEAADTSSRRNFLRTAVATLGAATLGAEALGQQGKPNAQDAVQLPPLHNVPTEGPERSPAPSEAQPQRTGYAVVGLGDLAIKEILPAFGASKYSKVVALVSGDRAKAGKIAAQYGIKDSSIYSYETYDQLAQNPEVQVIYIVLPNSMHAEFVLRGAKAGKHILCEKPMATSAKDCERMIAACNSANVKLMIAYRQQYEPMNRAIVKMVKEGKLGTLKSFVASNSQNQGDPGQWRQKLALAGGGCLPDVGIYCLNAARFLTEQEPEEVWGTTYQPRDDPRFAEVEETCSFTAKFPSGMIATCSTGYGAHRSQFLRLEGDKGWAELSPAFGYGGLKLRIGTLHEEQNVTIEPTIESKDQFALEMDHMSLCVQQNLQPHTPGEEGLQDQHLTDAIYKSAKIGSAVKVSPPAKPTRGPEPTTD